MRSGSVSTDTAAGVAPAVLLERAQGVLLGLAVGDALGATVEFLTPGEIRAKFGTHRRIVGGGWLHLKPGQLTDDTEMSLCIARTTVARGGWDLRAVAESFAAWLRSRPVDVGATCARGIRRYLHAGTLEAPVNEWDAGNGAAMRVAPVALLTLGDDALLARLAVEQARLTHHHGEPLAPGHQGLQVHHGAPIRQGCTLGHPRPGVLLDRQALPGEGRLVHGQVLRVDDPGVRRHVGPRLEHQHIAGRHLSGVEPHGSAPPGRRRPWGARAS